MRLSCLLAAGLLAAACNGEPTTRDGSTAREGSEDASTPTGSEDAGEGAADAASADAGRGDSDCTYFGTVGSGCDSESLEHFYHCSSGEPPVAACEPHDTRTDWFCCPNEP